MVAAKTALKKSLFIIKKGMETAGRFIIWGAAISFLLFVLLQCVFWGAVGWLNSSYGQKTVQEALGQALDGSQNRIVLGGMSYIFPTKMHLGNLTLYQGEEKHIEISGLNVAADLFALSRRELPVFLNANSVIVHPLEADSPKEADAQPVAFPILIPPLDLPDLPFDRVLLKDVSIDELIMKGREDIMLSPSLSGRIDIFTGETITVELAYKDDSKNPSFPKDIKVRGQYDTAESSVHIRALAVSAPLYAISGKAGLNFSENGELTADLLIQANSVKDLSIVSAHIQAENKSDFVAELTVNGQYQEQNINIKTAAKAAGDKIRLNPITINLPGVTANGNVAINTASSLISGNVSGRLSSINPYRNLIGNDHDISLVNFNLKLSEAAAQQKMSFSAETASYQNIPSGLTFNDLMMQGSVSGNTLNISSITAKDNKGGTFNANAEIALNTMAVDMSVTARDLNAVRGDMVNATLNMDVNVKGTPDEYTVKGKIMPQIVNVKLPERFATNIPQLNVVNKNAIGNKAEQEIDILEKVRIDMLIDAPSQIFVRGWGLDSEFGGQVKIKGYADDPMFDGSFSIIRGRYSEFGRNFNLTKGMLFFAGSVPPYPKFDIVAETKTSDILARVEIKGSPEKPKISFSSDPLLPEDEVLSHILFGKNMSSITPFQAVKLTQTLQRFSGNGGGMSSFDPLDTVRSATGLDDLRVEADEDGGATVGAGKYLTDKVYLEFEAGSGENSGNANIEIEVTPNITVESEIGQDAQGGAGVFWKWDY